MWEVVGRPFRLVRLDRVWIVVGVGEAARRVLVEHELLARAFATRTAAVGALSAALASRNGTATGRGRDVGRR